MKIILSFCGNCGVKLKTGENPCGNCNAETIQRNQRCEGTFDEADGNRLRVLMGEEPIIGRN